MRIRDKQFEHLIHGEGLDDIETLLTPREWDEVPFVSRLSRIEFLSSLDAREKSRILVVNAVKYLECILNFADRRKRDDVVVMVSVINWEDLQATDPDPVIPNFWISTNAQRDLAKFRLRPSFTKEGNLVREWLNSENLLQAYEVFDAVEAATDPELQRVYIAQRGCLRVKPFIAQQQKSPWEG